MNSNTFASSYIKWIRKWEKIGWWAFYLSDHTDWELHYSEVCSFLDLPQTAYPESKVSNTLKKHQITLQIFRERSSSLWKIILNSHYCLSTVSILSEKFLNSNVLSLMEVHRIILKSGFVFFHLILNLVFFFFPWGKEHHFFIFPWNIFFSLVQMKLHYFWWRRKWRCQHLMLIQRHPPHAIKAAAWKGLCVPWTIIRLRRYE